MREENYERKHNQPIKPLPLVKNGVSDEEEIGQQTPILAHIHLDPAKNHLCCDV